MLYHYAVNGTQHDPIEESALRDKIIQGVIGPGALCWRDGWAEWRRVSDAFPELFGATAQPAGSVGLRGGLGASASTELPREQAESMRNQYLTHEASVKSIGSLYIFGAVMMVGMGAVMCFAPAEEDMPKAASAALGVLFIILGAVQFWVGRGLVSSSKCDIGGGYGIPSINR